MEITLLFVLQSIINRYCQQHSITSMSHFAELAGIDRDIVSSIYNKPAPYCPTWGVVCAIAVACDVTTAQIKQDVRPLYTAAHARSERQTSHRQRSIAREEVATDRLRPLTSKEEALLQRA